MSEDGLDNGSKNISVKETGDNTPRLLETARIIIDSPIPLITDKNPEIIPPKANNHDYISIDPYWYEGENIPRDGEINPAVNNFPDPNKLDQAVNGILITSLAAENAQDPIERKKFAQRAIATLNAWFVDENTRMIPSLEYAQMKPGEETGNFYGIIEGASLIRATEGIKKLKEAGLIDVNDDKDKKTLDGVDQWFKEYLEWLLTSKKAIGNNEAENEKERKGEKGMSNNHGTFYDVQVAYIADFLGKSDVAEEALKRARDRIGTQILPTGEMPAETARKTEKIDVSNDYQIFNLYGFSELAELAQKYKIDLWHEEINGRSLQKAFEYFIDQLKSAGDNPFKFDRTGPLYLAFRAASRAYGNKPYWDLPGNYYQNPLVDEITQEMFQPEKEQL